MVEEGLDFDRQVSVKSQETLEGSGSHAHCGKEGGCSEPEAGGQGQRPRPEDVSETQVLCRAQKSQSETKMAK